MNATQNGFRPKTTILEFPDTPAGKREWIKASLAKLGLTLGKIARELNCSRSAAQVALWRPYPRMERELARRLGMQPWDIWPERYSDGRSLCRAYRTRHFPRGGAR